MALSHADAMTAQRIQILGASGTGTSTLGRAMADAWSVPFHDTDEYFWAPTEPPYTQPRPKADRLALMEAMFLPHRAWVLSGSLMGWAEPVLPQLDLAVFLTLDPVPPSAPPALARGQPLRCASRGRRWPLPCAISGVHGLGGAL